MYGYGFPSYPQYGPVGQRQELIRVNGLEGARAYQMPPNSVAALFDANQDLMYIKATDGAGFPSIRVFSFAEQIQAGGMATPNAGESQFQQAIDKINETLD